MKLFRSPIPSLNVSISFLKFKTFVSCFFRIFILYSSVVISFLVERMSIMKNQKKLYQKRVSGVRRAHAFKVALALGICFAFGTPKLAFAENATEIRAGSLAETGDMIAILAIAVGLIAVVALIVSIMSKKAKAKNKSTWKYPF